MLFERVLAKRELVSEVMREKSREGIVETPEMCDDSRAGRERMKVCSSPVSTGVESRASRRGVYSP
jgi:hypothetical protein